jgi:hypothetical protein
MKSKKGMLPMIVIVLLIVAAVVLLIIPMLGIYRLLVSPMIQWGLLAVLLLWLLSSRKVRGMLTRIFR